ncbi:MAG: polysaccharide deacetylase family protein [Bacteroidales bacterium]
MKRVLLLTFSLVVFLTAFSQEKKNLAELLGYPRDSKLVIIHADDMGLSNSVNNAVIKAFETGGITSGSLMMPCPWANDMCAWVRDHPNYDVGIHTTLTAEWFSYKWNGLVAACEIPSLLDKNGYFYSTVEDLGKVARGAEASKELHAQINKAISFGIKPSHIDTHMGSVLANPELIQVYLGLSEEYKLPILFPRQYLSYLPADVAKMLGNKIWLLDNLFMLDERSVQTFSWEDAYRKGVESLKPGLNQIIVHLGYDNEEMKAITRNHDDFGSAWRQKDLDFVNSQAFRDMLKKNKAVLITWRQIRDLMNNPSFQ